MTGSMGLGGTSFDFASPSISIFPEPFSPSFALSLESSFPDFAMLPAVFFFQGSGPARTQRLSGRTQTFCSGNSARIVVLISVFHFDRFGRNTQWLVLEIHVFTAAVRARADPARSGCTVEMQSYHIKNVCLVSYFLAV